MTWIWYGYVLSYGRFDLHPNSWPVGGLDGREQRCLAHLVQEVGQTLGSSTSSAVSAVTKSWYAADFLQVA